MAGPAVAAEASAVRLMPATVAAKRRTAPVTRAATPASSAGSMATSRTPERLDGPRLPLRAACTCTYRPAPVQMGSVKAWAVPRSSTTSRGAVNHGPQDSPSPLVRRRIVTAPAGGTSHMQGDHGEGHAGVERDGRAGAATLWPGDGERAIGRPQRLEIHRRGAQPGRRRATRPRCHPDGDEQRHNGHCGSRECLRHTRVPHRERCRHVAADLHWSGRGEPVPSMGSARPLASLSEKCVGAGRISLPAM